MKSVYYGAETVRLLRKSLEQLNIDEEKMYGEYGFSGSAYWSVPLVKSLLTDSENGKILFPVTEIESIALGVRVAWRQCQFKVYAGNRDVDSESDIQVVSMAYSLRMFLSEIQEEWGHIASPSEKAIQAFKAYEQKALSIQMTGGDC